MKLSRLIFIVALFIFMAGCSMSKDSEIAEKKIPEFHSLLDSGRFKDIYAASADDLKKASKEDEFVALLEAVSRKLGKVRTTERMTWNVNYHTSGTFVTLAYKTAYAEGDASEQFVYRIIDGQAKLAGYHINSNILITK